MSYASENKISKRLVSSMTLKLLILLTFLTNVKKFKISCWYEERFGCNIRKFRGESRRMGANENKSRATVFLNKQIEELKYNAE